jgi:hypothetical protein
VYIHIYLYIYNIYIYIYPLTSLEIPWCPLVFQFHFIWDTLW